MTIEGWALLAAVVVASGVRCRLGTRRIRAAHREARDLASSLRRSELLYRTVVTASRQGIWVVDRDLRTTLVNSRLAQLLGCTEAELYTRPPSDFLPLCAGLPTPAEMDAWLARGECEFELLMPRLDGSAFHVVVVPQVDACGRFSGAVAVVRGLAADRAPARAAA